MNKYFKHRHKIAHLSKEEKDKLADKYYAGENVKDLISTYNINISSGSFYLVLPLKKDPHFQCPYCNANMFILPPSKSRKYAKALICNACWHVEGKYNCECRNCILKKQDEAHAKKLQRTINKSSNNTQETHLLDESKTVRLKNLSETEKIYLGALLRVYPPIKSCLFIIDTKMPSNLAPSIILKNKIFSALFDNNIIFEISRLGTIIKLSFNIVGLITDKEQLLNLMYPNKIKEVTEDILDIIRDLQIYEAVEYFSIIANKQFSIPNINQIQIDEEFYALFKIILENNYSTAQLHNFIYTGIRNYAAKHNCDILNANPTIEIYQNITRYYNSAVNEKWNIKNYNRAYSIQPSELFKIVANDLLNINEALFYKSVSDNLVS